MAMRGSAAGRCRYRPVPLDSIAPALREAALDRRGRPVLGSRRDRLPGDAARAGVPARPVRLGLRARSDGAVAGGGTRTWRRRDALRGASTITQQVAKNLYLSPSRNPLRKLKEAVTAYRLERALGKPRILELYLNIAELGDGIWGVEAASRRYFRLSARRLTETQAAALAATLPFPLRSNPAYRPNRMRRRQDLILRRMRGERVEVPHVEEEPVIQPGDTIQWTPGVDSLLDSLRAPVETLPPTPADVRCPPQSDSEPGRHRAHAGVASVTPPRMHRSQRTSRAQAIRLRAPGSPAPRLSATSEPGTSASRPAGASRGRSRGTSSAASPAPDRQADQRRRARAADGAAPRGAPAPAVPARARPPRRPASSWSLPPTSFRVRAPSAGANSSAEPAPTASASRARPRIPPEPSSSWARARGRTARNRCAYVLHAVA